MIKKTLSFFLIIGFLLTINPVSAQKENPDKINFPQQKVFSLPDNAVQIDDNVYKLTPTRDPKSGEMVEGYAIVHRKNPMKLNQRQI